MKVGFTIRMAATAAMLTLLLATGCKQRDKAMSDSPTNHGNAAENVELPNPSVTRELFMKWRSPRSGMLDRGARHKSLVENIDDWRLHLDDWRWERLTERRWSRWEVRRKDGEMNHLFDYQQALWAKETPALNDSSGTLARLKTEFEIPSLQAALGKPPDLELFVRRYKPSVSHEELPKSEDEFNVHRLKINGVIVRYVEEMDSVQISVEGELPQGILDALTRDLLDKMSALENAPCELIRL